MCAYTVKHLKNGILFHGVGKGTIPVYFAVEHKISLTIFILVIRSACCVSLLKRIKRKKTVNLRVRYHAPRLPNHCCHEQVTICFVELLVTSSNNKHLSGGMETQQRLAVELQNIPYCCQRYTGCPRRNELNFGRVFLMLNYTDITQNTYIQS